ncbi:CRISPR-associated protein Cas7 [Hymenobacter gummosus]|uniref:CRISPR-associated protein Cas7 n=1 Tax=Hymenobacter gummosus TaxID=1776032 RepID=A0A3S0HCE2_9BACT|nr:CRISPR-associated protein Cas7 [Hymenobacter gummosus]RTQ53396.1 CRISPR-associated protein Cas7 [Hymenobacter gummosus]
MKPYLYLRGLRHAEHTVFAVQDGQKYYRDPQFGTNQAYSSGQQVKRSIMDALTSGLNVPPAPITFNWQVKKGKKDDVVFEQKEPWSPCDPRHVDQLLGGYMRAETGEFTIKRRSPLSISAMRPLHPLLGGLEQQRENLTFDRTSHPAVHPVRVRDENGNELDQEAVDALLLKTKRNLPNRIWIPDHTRASGLFVYDVCVDLRTLFCVSTNTLEPELHPSKLTELKDLGWTETRNAFGPCLLAPREERERYMPALAHALLNWRITSNQARTFSLMETLAVAISDNANHLAGAIRGQLREDSERPAAKPVLDENAGARLFTSLAAGGYIAGAYGAADALEQAEQYVQQQLRAFDYENQLIA